MRFVDHLKKEITSLKREKEVLVEENNRVSSELFLREHERQIASSSQDYNPSHVDQSFEDDYNPNEDSHHSPVLAIDND
jgi:hypothetical protein